MTKETICFFNTNKPWGGGEKFNYDFAQLMNERGYDVHAVCNSPSDLGDRLEKIPGITVHRMGVSNLTFVNPVAMFRLYRLFKKMRPRTVVFALPNDLKAGGIAAWLAGVPERIFRRGIDVPTKDTALNRFLFKNVITKLICNSLGTKTRVLQNNPDMIEDERTHLVHCGFDVQEFDDLDSTPLVPRRGSEVIIGNAARLTPQKGQALLIRAAHILKKKGLDFRVLIAGSGELEDELKSLARELDVHDRVEFLGFITDLKGFHASLDIFALSSLWEGFCYAQVESMTLERPVVAFNVSSIPEVVIHEETGYLVEAEDVEAYAARLEQLIRDPELRARLGSAGRKRVIENFEIHKVLDDFEKVIHA